MDIHKKYPRSFLSPKDDLCDPETIRCAYNRLQQLPMESKGQAEKWLSAWSEICSAVAEVVVRAYFAVTRDTRDQEAEREYNRLVEQVIPLSKELDEKALSRFLSFPQEWIPKEMGIARLNAQWEVELYRKENLPLIAENLKMENEYNKITGAWETEFEGKQVTYKQLEPYLELPDRDLRERAWRARMGLHGGDYERLNELFDRMLSVRKVMAKSADLDDYVAYQYKNYKRLSYDRKEAEEFRRSILEFVVPSVTKIFERRAEKMGIDAVYPWDLKANPEGAQPPKIYETLEELKAKTASVLGSVDEQFSSGFRLMDEMGYLDLENRPGKAPGAYMNEFAEERLPLIFANSVGTSKDFDTLIHEGGHAMHGLLSRHLLYHAREVPIEFAEVASMSLELLARPYWEVVYNELERRRIGIYQLEEALVFLPFMAMMDGFQEWVYTNPDGENPQNRADYWRKLEGEYRPHINYAGLEGEQNLGWQYNHVFTVPLYYIEYGIAQIGALQIYLRSLDDYQSAVNDYKCALSLGNTVSLPQLFATAGVKFVMKEPQVLEEVTRKVMRLIGLE